MTPEEITKLAETLAKDWIEANNLPNCLGNEVLSGMAREMERVVRFILRSHCIVEKSEMEDAEEVTIDGWVARDRLNNGLFLHDEKPYRSFSGYQTDGKEDEWRSDTCPPYPIDYDSFPSLTWESEPLEVTITIKPRSNEKDNVLR